MTEDTDENSKAAFQQVAQLSPELESEFRKREAAFRDFLAVNPEATMEEIVAYRQRIKPKDKMQARAFTKWCVRQIKRELDIR